MASKGLRGRERIVAGLSPVNGIIEQSDANPHLETKYLLMGPRHSPPSKDTAPSFFARSSGWPFEARDSSFLLNWPASMSHRFIPQTSEISIGATRPRKIDARNEDTSEILEV